MSDDRVKQELLSELSTLHEMLRDTPELDPALHDELTTVAEDIDRLLHPQESETSSHEEIAKQVQDTVSKFKTEHPMVVALLGRISDALAAMGI